VHLHRQLHLPFLRHGASCIALENEIVPPSGLSRCPASRLTALPLLGFSLSDGHSIRGMLLSSIDLIEPLLQFPVDRILTCTYKDSIDYTFHRGFGFHFRRAPQIRGLRSAGFRLPRSGNPRADFIEIQSRLLAMSPTSVSSPMRLERRDASIRDRFIEPPPPPRHYFGTSRELLPHIDGARLARARSSIAICYSHTSGACV